MQAITTADQQGLRRDDYLVQPLADALAPLQRPGSAPDAATAARADVLLSAAFVRYVDDVLTGRTDPADVEPAWHIRPRAHEDVQQALRRVIDAPDLSAGLRSLQPRDDDYALLQRGLARYRHIARQGGWPSVAKGDVLRPGGSDARLATLRRRLGVEGFTPTTAAARGRLDL